MSDPVVSATQPKPVNMQRLFEHDRIAVFQVNFDRPKRPVVWAEQVSGAYGSIEVEVRCEAGDDTPESHSGESLTLTFTVTGAQSPLVLRYPRRYAVDIVFIDRGAA